MQGSLDQPPIIVRDSHFKTLSALMVGIVFVTVCVIVLKDPPPNPGVLESSVVLYPVTAFSGLVVLLATLRLIRPSQLTLAPDGITWRNVLRTYQWRWDEVQNFRSYRPLGYSLSKDIRFDYANHPFKAIGGVECSLGTGWELRPGDLAELLNKARSRWGSRSTVVRIQINDGFAFTWEANGEEIASLMANFPRVMTDQGGDGPMQAAQSVLKHIADKGALLDDDEVSQDGQMLALTWLVLNQETHNADHPGKIAAYAENMDFDVKIDTRRGDTEFDVAVQAVSKLNR